MEALNIVKVEGNGLDCYAWVECVPNIGPRATAGHVMVRPDDMTHLGCYWVEAKNCKVIEGATDIFGGKPVFWEMQK